MSTNFHDKLTKLKQAVAEKSSKNNENSDQNKLTHTCSNIQLKIDCP